MIVQHHTKVCEKLHIEIAIFVAGITDVNEPATGNESWCELFNDCLYEKRMIARGECDLNAILDS